MRTGVEVRLGPGDRERLEAVVGSGNSPQKHVWRARIVLLSADGIGTMEIQRRTGKGKPTIWRWQARFMAEGVDGLLHEATRPAGKAPLTSAVIERVVEMTLAEPPGETTHWTCRAMAKAAGVSHRSVQRIWAAHGLKPHRVSVFKLSNDPKFAAKVQDVVGLYVDPPDHALVLSVDRSELAALDVADLEFSGEGVAITIRRSKTDQEGAGQVIGIPRGNGLCPMRALREWLDAAGIDTGPVFRPISRSGRCRVARISDHSIAAIVKQAAARIGLDSARFAGHSLRSGFATSASAAGADLARIMQQTRHRSEAVSRGYVQRGSVFQNRAVRSLEL